MTGSVAFLLGATLFATLAAFVVIWLISRRLSDCGIVDIYWGAGFVLIAWMELLGTQARSLQAIAITALVTLWGARLTWHLFRRHRRSRAEDARYAAMRARSGPDWPTTSLWRLFLVQGAAMWLVASPIHVGLLAASREGPATAVMLGALVFAVGFVIEAAADSALARFAQDESNRGRLLVTGLFAWSRHPNYFGETLVWWGLGLMAWGATGNVLAFFGPALLTFLLLKVSGVPPLEEHLSSRPGFADYARATSAFVPLPPRRIGSVATREPAPGPGE
jgi:steroid 5-alpha reductase family enzyme